MKCHQNHHFPHNYIRKRNYLMLSDSLMGFPGGASGKNPTCQCRRHKTCGFDPWVRKILWRRAWQPTAVSLPGESWTEEPGRLQSMGSQRVRQNWATSLSFFLFSLCMGYQDWPSRTHIVPQVFWEALKGLPSPPKATAKSNGLILVKPLHLYAKHLYAPSLRAIWAFCHLLLESCCFLVSYL